MSFIEQYWPILLGLLLIALIGLSIVFLRRGQRVTLSSDAAPRPTLSRNASGAVPVPAPPRAMTIDDVRMSIVKSEKRDNLMEIKGISAPIATVLAGLGVKNFEQLSTLSAEQLDVINHFVRDYNARAVEDQWAKQAALLAAGDREGYDAIFGKMEPTGG